MIKGIYWKIIFPSVINQGNIFNKQITTAI